MRSVMLLAALVLLASLSEAQPGASPATVDGRPAPVVDLSRFLATEFSTSTGEVYFGTGRDMLLFPPAGLRSYEGEIGRYRLLDADGRVLAWEPIEAVRETDLTAFVSFTMTSGGGQQLDGPLAPGAYVQEVVFGGRVVGHVPFTVAAVQSGDPFDQETAYQRDGPWRTLAFFEHEAGAPEQALRFNAWVSAAEMASRQPLVDFVLTRGGRPVAATDANAPPNVSGGEADWILASGPLWTYASHDTPNRIPFAIGDLTAGDYVLTVRHRPDGAVIRSYPVRAGAGTIEAHPRSDSAYEPRTDYLAPRRIWEGDAQAVVWVEAGE